MGRKVKGLHSQNQLDQWAVDVTALERGSMFMKGTTINDQGGEEFEEKNSGALLNF